MRFQVISKQGSGLHRELLEILIGRGRKECQTHSGGVRILSGAAHS